MPASTVLTHCLLNTAHPILPPPMPATVPTVPIKSLKGPMDKAPTDHSHPLDLPQQIYVPQLQYPPQQPFVNPYGPQPQGFPYGYGYPYLDQSQLTQANVNKEIEKPEADDEEEEEDEDSYEEEDDYKRRYYPYRNIPYTQPYNY